MSQPLHKKTEVRVKIAAAVVMYEPDRLKGVLSAVDACSKLGLAYIVEDIADAGDDNRPDFKGRFMQFATGQQGDKVMIVTDALMSYEKDLDFHAAARNIAHPIKKNPKGCPRVIFIEQMGVKIPQMIARDVEIVKADTPTRAEITMEFELFLKDNPKTVLDDGLPEPEVKAETEVEQPAEKKAKGK